MTKRKGESGPGWAKFTAKDTKEDVDRKMADAFAPLRAMREALRRLDDEK